MPNYRHANSFTPLSNQPSSKGQPSGEGKPSGEGMRVAMRVAEIPITELQPTPGPTPTVELYPAPTPTQSAYQENIFTHFVAFLKDLFGAQPVYAAVSQAPTAVIVPIGEVYFLLSDHLGSTTVTLNLDGSVESEIRSM